MLLSICIPSYNRFGELRKLLQSIAEAKSQDFDVFVVDNGSKDNVLDLEFDDSRIKFVKRDKVIPGPVNCRTCLDFGDGDYRMLCLDKDFVVGEFLDNFIEELKRYNEVTCGYCVLNSKKDNGKIQIQNSDIENAIYRCGHPSGYFVRADIVQIENNILNQYDEKSVFYSNPFLQDLLYSQGLMHGKEAIYDGRLIEPEKPEQSRKIKTFSYGMKNDSLYFLPDERRNQFEIFCRHLKLLKFDKTTYEKIVEKLYIRTLNDCTFGYKDIMKRDAICQHYGIACKKIGFKDISKEKKKFVDFFLANKETNLSNEKKLLIIKKGNTSLCRGYIKMMLHR